jgi:hypothetical protein
MANVWRVLGAGVLVVASGCGTDRVSRYIDQSEGLIEYVCTTCPAATGAGNTEAECREVISYERPTATQEACLRRVYEENSAELDPVADCQYEASSNWERCLRTAIETCPPNADDVSLCGMALSEDTERCPLPSEATAAETQACLE